jgi:hypothetical protein
MITQLVMEGAEDGIEVEICGYRFYNFNIHFISTYFYLLSFERITFFFNILRVCIYTNVQCTYVYIITIQANSCDAHILTPHVFVHVMYLFVITPNICTILYQIVSLSDLESHSNIRNNFLVKNHTAK